MAEDRDRPESEGASRVLIIDDSPAVREGLRALVETDATLRTVGEAANAADGLRLARALHPDLILLDNEMPGMRGIELLPTLRSELPGTRVIMFSLSPSISDEARALGASAVVSKDGSQATLLETLRQVRRGEDSTTVRLAAFARLRPERPHVPVRKLGALAAVIVVALAGSVWTMTGHPADLTMLGIGAIALLAIGAGSGALRLSGVGRHRSDLVLAEAIGAGATGGDEFVRLVRSALGCDAAMLFALSNGGRQLRVVSTTGVSDFDTERTFVGLPALARSVREARVVVIESGDDLIAGARSAAFAPVMSEDGTPLGVLAVFYRRVVTLTPLDHRRLRAVAIAAEAALASE